MKRFYAGRVGGVLWVVWGLVFVGRVGVALIGGGFGLAPDAKPRGWVVS